MVFFSYDGAKYGVPWQYSGKDICVRLVNGSVEVYHDEVLLTKHDVQSASGNVVWLPGQYAGLTAENGMMAPRPAAVQIESPEVEKRSLDIYDQLLEVSHG